MRMAPPEFENITQRETAPACIYSTLAAYQKCAFTPELMNKFFTDNLPAKINLFLPSGLIVHATLPRRASIQDANGVEIKTFELDRSLVREAIANGARVLFYILERTPSALGKVAKLELGVQTILDPLALSEASASLSKTPAKPGSGRL